MEAGRSWRRAFIGDSGWPWSGPAGLKGVDSAAPSG